MLPKTHSSPSMGKEWVPPGENVGDVSICYFWLAGRCSCLPSKNILTGSTRLLEENGHPLALGLCSVEKKPKEREASRQHRGWALELRAGDHGWLVLVFSTWVGWSLSVPSKPTPLASPSHPALCPEKLTFRHSSYTTKSQRLTKGRHQPMIGGWEERDTGNWFPGFAAQQSRLEGGCILPPTVSALSHAYNSV